MLLDWKDRAGHREAILGTRTDGVTFCLSRHPTCYRRGPYKLRIEVCGGANHHCWGCFDEVDAPVRWYHYEANALSEAEAIAAVLWADRQRHGKETISEPVIYCHECGEDDPSKLGFIAPYADSDEWKCLTCGHRWQANKRPPAPG